MKARIRFAGVLVFTASVVIVGLSVAPIPAQAQSSLLAWTAQADANPIDLVIDNASGLGGSHPLTEIVIPEDSSNFGTGPLGYSLASILWPGAVGGNLGSVASEAGLPSSLAPIANGLNDPVRAESYYPSGPESDTYPSNVAPTGVFKMSSFADATESSAKAGVTDASITGLLDAQNVQGDTNATATSQAKSTASGAFSGLSLLGGLIKIGASSFSAEAQSDGMNPSGIATTNIGAITVAGIPASVGSRGLVLGPAGGNVSGLLNIPVALADQILSAINLQVAVLPQTQSSTAPTEAITSGGLSVSFSLPSNLNLSLNCTALPQQLSELNILCHLPDELQGLKFAFTLGHVTATATAAQPFSIPAGAASGTSVSPTLSTSASLPGQNVLGSTLSTPSLSSNTTPSTAGTPSSTIPVQPLTGLLAVSLSSPIGSTLLIILLLLAIACGLGFRRFATSMASATPANACPLEEEP